MNKTNRNQIIFVELILVVFFGLGLYSFSTGGVRWTQIQVVALLLFLISLVPLVFEAKARQSCFLNAKSMILFGVMYWVMLDPLKHRAGIEAFAPVYILKVFLMVILFLVTVQLGYMIRWPMFFLKYMNRFDPSVYRLNRHKLAFMVLVFLFIGVLIPLMVYGGGFDRVVWELTHGGRWSAGWQRGRFGGWSDYFLTGAEILKMAGIQLGFFYVLFVRRNYLILALTILGVWTVFDTGTRSAFGGTVIPAIILIYLNLYNHQKRWRFLFLPVCILVLLSVMQFQLYLRDSDYKPYGDIFKVRFEEIVEANPTEYHRDDQFLQMLKYAEVMPKRIPHSGEFLVLRPVYHFIPRALWPSKPEGPLLHFEKLTNLAGQGQTTWASSVIGEFYLTQSWFGICTIGLFMGLLAYQADALIPLICRSPIILLIYGYGILFLFLMIRSYQIFYEGWYSFLFIYMVFLITRKKVRYVSTVAHPHRVMQR